MCTLLRWYYLQGHACLHCGKKLPCKFSDLNLIAYIYLFPHACYMFRLSHPCQRSLQQMMSANPYTPHNVILSIIIQVVICLLGIQLLKLLVMYLLPSPKVRPSG
jgi:hypothetical protein